MKNRTCAAVAMSSLLALAGGIALSGCEFQLEPSAPVSAEHAQMLGRPAPALDLELLGGGHVSLAEHEGEVVILDFWATWCPPCVRGLPMVASVAEAYREQGVVLYAVNVREAPETVRAFLEAQELQLKVPMDRDADVSRRYGVGGIPQTVIIGRDGTVQAVHVGFSPELEDRLLREVEALLAGEKLATSGAGR